MVQLLNIYRHILNSVSYYTASKTAISVVCYTGSDVTYEIFLFTGHSTNQIHCI